MIVNCCGRNRWVLLTRRYAIKVPSLRTWRDFLFGLLNNMTEAQWGRKGLTEYCPVLWALPGGFAVVMPRVKVLDLEEFQNLDLSGYKGIEHKPDSFGWLGGRLVCVDYGWRHE